MNVKDYLKACMELAKVVDQKLDELEILRSKAERVTTIHSNSPQYGNKKILEDIIVKMMSVEAKLKKDVEEYMIMRQNIEEMISKLRNPSWQAVMMYRYLCGYSWNGVAEKTGYSTHSVRHIHGHALKELIQNEEEAKPTHKYT